MGRRTQQAAAAILRLDPAAALRAVTNPDSLTELEQSKLHLFSDANDKWTQEMLDTATDPFMLLGLALHLRFPIASAGKMFSGVAENLTGLRVADWPIVSSLKSFLPMFRGTTLENAYADAVDAKRTAQVGWTGEAETTLKSWLADQGRVSKFLRPAALSAEENIAMYADDVQATLAPFGVDARPRMPDEIRRLKEGLQRGLLSSWDKVDAAGGNMARALRNVGEPLEVGHTPELIQDYLPHQPVRDLNALVDEAHSIIASSQGVETAQARAAQAARTRDYVPSALRVREGRMLPSVEDLRLLEEKMPGVVAAGTADAVQALADETGMKQYSLRLVDRVLPRHYSNLARAYALTTEGGGAAVANGVDALRIMAGGKDVGEFEDALAKSDNPAARARAADVLEQHAENMRRSGLVGLAEDSPIALQAKVNAQLLVRAMETTYLPLLQRDSTVAQATWNLRATSTKIAVVNAIDSLKEAWGEKAPGIKSILDPIRSSLTSEEGLLNRPGAKLTGWLTGGALAGNLSASLQNFSTTVLLSTMIGPGHTAEGIKRATAGMGEYLSLRRTEGEWAAWRKAFPEFAASGLVNDPLSDEVRTMMDAGYKVAGGAKAALRDFQRVLMSPFSGGESAQRLFAFYGARSKGLADMAGIAPAEIRAAFGTEDLGAAASKYGSRLVRESQFAAGPASTPQALLNLPGPLRHFLSFGARSAEQLFASTAWASGGEGAIKSGPLAGRSFGNVGRLMLAGSLIEGMGRAVGQDWSGYSAFSGMPLPRDYGPFAPFPFVPPIVSLLGAGVMDLQAGELNQVKRSLPLLVPGGVAAARAVGLASPRVAQALNREWTDWQPDAQGKYPLFDGRGRSRGQYSAFQLYVRAAGLPVGDMQAEQEARTRIIAQSQRIKDARKEYLRMSVGGDVAGAEGVREDFKRAFGVPLDVRAQDWDVARLHMRMARNQALIGTMPKDVQPQLYQMANIDMVNSGLAASRAGVDPGLLDPRYFWSNSQPPPQPRPLNFGYGRGAAPPPQQGQFALPSFAR